MMLAWSHLPGSRLGVQPASLPHPCGCFCSAIRCNIYVCNPNSPGAAPSPGVAVSSVPPPRGQHRSLQIHTPLSTLLQEPAPSSFSAPYPKERSTVRVCPSVSLSSPTNSTVSLQSDSPHAEHERSRRQRRRWGEEGSRSSHPVRRGLNPGMRHQRKAEKPVEGGDGFWVRPVFSEISLKNPGAEV